MLINPFTPSTIVSSPKDFFGRRAELRVLTRALKQGSVAIHGGVGIGKSSLLSRFLLHIDGFMSSERCEYIHIVGNSDINSVDDAARLLLEKLITVDSTQRKLKIGLKILEFESQDSYSFFTSGRHLAAFNKLLENRSFADKMNEIDQFVIAIDEADKCPRPLARLIRAICTDTQLSGITNIRFALAGVSPYIQEMISEDPGIRRMFYKTILLGQLNEDEGRDLIETKLTLICEDAAQKGFEIIIDSGEVGIVDTILKLSGLHPALIQLLGSQMVERECEDPDNRLDIRDLVGSLRVICYESRGDVYTGLMHQLKINDKFESFLRLLELAPRGLPTIIDRYVAIEELQPEDLEWFRSHGLISLQKEEYRLVDEFFRIRLLLDQEEQEEDELEREILDPGDVVYHGDEGSELIRI